MQPENPYGAPAPQWQPPAGPNPYQPSQQYTHGQGKHPRSSLLIPFIIVVVLLMAALSVLVWALQERSTYKNKTSQIVDKEVQLAKQQVISEKEKEFVEREKQPYVDYEGPAQFGSLKVVYPKTWSAFVTESDKDSVPVDGYFHPDYVPAIESGTSFALRVQVLNNTYDEEVKKLDSRIKSGKVTLTPYTAKNVPSVLGVRVKGEINEGKQTDMILFPIRDKTLKVFTESDQFRGDFDKVILEQLVFVP